MRDLFDSFLDELRRWMPLIVMILVFSFVAWLAGCGPVPAKSVDTEVESSENWFCVVATGDNNESFLGCATTELACERNRAKAKKWGRWARIKEIGPCVLVEVAP